MMLRRVERISFLIKGRGENDRYFAAWRYSEGVME